MVALEAQRVDRQLSLRNARSQLGLSQEELGRLADIHFNVISRCERGFPISSLSAWALLNALNAERAKRNLPPLEYKQMDWKIKGE